MYERADIVLVVAGSVVLVLLNLLQVLHHVAGDGDDDCCGQFRCDSLCDRMGKHVFDVFDVFGWQSQVHLSRVHFSRLASRRSKRGKIL